MVKVRKLDGEVVAEVVEVRYAWSGKVARVNRRAGDRVKKGEILASMDRTLLQKELDRQLADYEKQRANFEIFAKRHPNPSDDLTIYAKKIEQADLDISVKDVEIAKMKLDQADMVCPVNGIIVDDGGNRPGLYVTPASNAIEVLDLDAVRVQVELTPDEAMEWRDEREIDVLAGTTRIRGKTRPPYLVGKKYILEVELDAKEALVVGMKVEVVAK